MVANGSIGDSGAELNALATFRERPGTARPVFEASAKVPRLTTASR